MARSPHSPHLDLGRLGGWLAAAALSIGLVGCATATVQNSSELPESPPSEAAPAETAAPPAEPPKEPAKDPAKEPKGSEPAAPAEAAKGARADGERCDKADDCSSGVCEGEGCGPGQGTCAPKERQCTLDLRAYCGCDGKTFQAGGNCPKARYAKKGACDGDPPPGIPAPKKIPVR